ncbi:MAG: archease [Nitrospirae bacterium]|nr:MAG: archease [Nitrospirota bacterium]
MAGSFRYLEDIAFADAAFEAWGESLSELFEGSARAVIELMVNPLTVAPTRTYVVELTHAEVGELLFDWLSYIVMLKDTDACVFHTASAEVSRSHATSQWSLRGTLDGEPIDHTRHELRSDVKAVTKHCFEVKQVSGRWIAKVVVDI